MLLQVLVGLAVLLQARPCVPDRRAERAGARAAERAGSAVPGFENRVDHDARLRHAQELLGARYGMRLAPDLERSDRIAIGVDEVVVSRLPPAWKKRAGLVSAAILRESRLQGFDPVFLLAIIETESSFRPDAVGSHGEIGLMQLMPGTARWLARKRGIAFHGERSLRDPVTNIRIGAAYLAFLRESFGGRDRLYVAAYNMGGANVRRALERRVWPRDYPARVMQKYVAFLLAFNLAVAERTHQSVQW